MSDLTKEERLRRHQNFRLVETALHQGGWGGVNAEEFESLVKSLPVDDVVQNIGYHRMIVERLEELTGQK